MLRTELQATSLPRLVALDEPGRPRLLMLVFVDQVSRQLKIHWLEESEPFEVYAHPLYVPGAVQPMG